MILAIDPGREKCGLAVLDNSANVLEKKVFLRSELNYEVVSFLSKYQIQTIVIGSGTSSKSLEKELSRIDLRCSLVFAPEKFSTLEARRKYWHDNPPRGLLRLVPASLLSPPVPIDDYAAVILGERYLNG